MPPQPAIPPFSWRGRDESREVWLYTLREGDLADDEKHVDFVIAVQTQAHQTDDVADLERRMRDLARERELELHFYAGPDHSDPLADRISIGFWPRRKAPTEPLVAWGDR